MITLTRIEPVTITAPYREGIFNARRQALFCENLALNGNARMASRAAEVSPQTAYRMRRSSPDFRACWDAALVEARRAAEEVLADRALNGVEEEVWYHGEVVAKRRRYDSRLLLAHLARLDRLAERVGEVLAPEEFDAALARLEAGEEVLSLGTGAQEGGLGGGDGGEGDEELPELEKHLRALEAEGWVDLPENYAGFEAEPEGNEEEDNLD